MTVLRIIFLSLVLTTLLRAGGRETLIQRLENVTASETCVYALKDRDGRGMDCLKIFQSPGNTQPGLFYGVYHVRQRGVFSVYLASSNDLITWETVCRLDDHGSQATIQPCENGGYLLAYEKDAPNSCWIRLRYYASLSDLSAAKYVNEFDVPRTLAPTAEGTPSFELARLAGGDIERSEIRLRFHFFQNVRVDQLASGELTDFKVWKAKALTDVNAEFIRNGWRGNLGDRDRFEWEDQTFYLQEMQRTRGDWSSWRVGLCDNTGKPIKTLDFRTQGHSTAFANPTASWIIDSSNQKKLVITLFLPSEGNAPSEVGTLMYVVSPP